MRQGRPLHLRIDGRESISAEHRDVMLESVTTSFQLHLQVPCATAARYYNAAVIVSAPMVAVAANSPLLFGRMLWEETRIPVFEQAVDTGPSDHRRVTFGNGYAVESLLPFFVENAADYPVLLPLALDQPSDRLAHLRLHNGTIWRWNRPLIGFDEDGTPHIRIEHRVMAAGPTMVDMAANMALFYGLAHSLGTALKPPESRLSFEHARQNFYTAARDGLACEVTWLDGTRRRLDQLLLEELIPLADEGLDQLKVDRPIRERWLGVIDERVRSGQTGAAWQRRYVARRGRDLVELTLAYQECNKPASRCTPGRLSRARACIGRCPSELQILHELPPRLLTIDSNQVADLLERPTLIHLPGQRPDRLFVSILLHGNEDVGLRAVQQCLHKYRGRPLPARFVAVHR